ncbi:hypothetical protein [Flavobacterium sp.]|uniref:hypothetical protein n=1 Tax=Flavobacterium sp. TaxID=239 RepID=UPI0039E24F3F
MIEILEKIIPFFVFTFFTSFFVVAVLIGAAKLHNKTIQELWNYKSFKICLPILLISGISLASLKTIIEKVAQAEIASKMSKSPMLIINNRSVRNDSIKYKLQNIESSWFERNTGKSEILVTLDNEKIRLVRSFSNKTVYWIYYEKYNTTSANCIGKIKTKLLDKY